MTEYTIKCKENPSDTISASAEPADGDVAFIVRNAGGFRQSVYTSPADARTFARGILAMADEVGGEEKEEATPADESTVRGIKVGDKVRILIDGAESAEVLRGDVFTVSRLSGNTIIVDFEEDDRAYKWYFRQSESLEKVTDEPVIDTSKIVVLDDSAPTRAAFLEQAADLMSGSQTYTAVDLTELADYLAGEK